MEVRCARTSFEFGDDGLGAGVGPYNGIVEGFAGLVVPDDGCFALVGDSHAGDAGAGEALAFEGLDCAGDAGFHGGDEFERVVFMPAEIWEAG